MNQEKFIIGEVVEFKGDPNPGAMVVIAENTNNVAVTCKFWIPEIKKFMIDEFMVKELKRPTKKKGISISS